MGISEDRFWRSSPDDLEPYIEVYQRRQFEIDRIAHRMGAYVYEAVASVASAFGKHSHPYPAKPMMADEEERIAIENMTEEERMDKVEDIFKMLCSTENRDKVVNDNG